MTTAEEKRVALLDNARQQTDLANLAKARRQALMSALQMVHRLELVYKEMPAEQARIAEMLHALQLFSSERYEKLKVIEATARERADYYMNLYDNTPGF